MRELMRKRRGPGGTSNSPSGRVTKRLTDDPHCLGVRGVLGNAPGSGDPLMALACGPRHVPGRAVVYRPPLRLLTRSPSRRCNARVDCGDSQQGGVASFALAHRLRIVVRNLHVDLRGSLDEFLLIETVNRLP